jgi:major type 1 subunit fimbrin (pilin)
MSKRLLSTALAAVIAAAGFAPSAQAASSGTINFTGKVLADTCTISVNGGSTVALPTVMTAAFGSTVGTVAGTTPFSVALSGCDTNTASAQMQFSGANIDSTTGNLKNTAASGSNVQIQLLNSSDAAINASTQANAPSIAVTAGAGSTQLKAQYISTATATSAGLVSSTVNFTLTYL